MRLARPDVSSPSSAHHLPRCRPTQVALRKTPRSKAVATSRRARVPSVKARLGLTGILCLSLAACAERAISEKEKPLAPGRWPEADEQCKTQPSPDWCQSLSSRELKQTDLEARTKFYYRPDGPVDTWRSYADQVIRGVSWAGDCDDLSSTVLDLLGRRGVPLKDRYRVLVSMAKNGKVDHMIGLAIDNHGKFWVVGDTNQQIYPVRAIYYQAIEYNRLSEMVDGEPVWRKGFP
jgi:hypothetical protein